MLLRRTRLGLLAARDLTTERSDGSPGAVQRVAGVMAGELSWSAQRTAEEIDAFRAEALAEGIVVQGPPEVAVSADSAAEPAR